MTDAVAAPRYAIIADDEDLGCLLLAEACADAGLTPLPFNNGADALAASRRSGVAIVLLDVDMPGLDGISVCRELRRDAALRHVPIVMVTGHEDGGAIDAAFAAGATDFVTKPVNWSLLPHRIGYILRNAASVRAVERLAYFDALTGLPNRQQCLEVAQRMIEAAAPGESVAAMFLDLHAFKRVNDTFGHAVGDTVLCRIAEILRGVTVDRGDGPPRTFLARFGGDEFVILVRGVDARQRAMRVANACHTALATPIVHDGLEFLTTPIVGVAVSPEHADGVEALLKNAETAMHQAKSSGAMTTAVYAPAMSGRLREWLDLEARLRRAVREERITLHFQPKFRISDGRLDGVEALARWYDPEYGEVSPSRFVAVAEESGLIVELGQAVTRAACRHLRQWLDEGFEVPVAINVSGKELLYADPATTIESALAEFRVPPRLLEVEITESVFIKDSTTLHRSLDRLRAIGCRIALDDFGTGYSSLAYVTRFPPDRIKIDRLFVHNVDRSPSDAAVASAILSLASNLGIEVTAEGVERVGQMAWLRARGCHQAQGFLLARPMSAEDLLGRHLRPQPAAPAEPDAGVA
jgi:diguanylate cyclase (GGDEF)-like protein